MADPEAPSPGGVHELLTAQARAWGRLSLVRGRILEGEKAEAEAETRLRDLTRDVERLERFGFRRLRAWLAGALPQVLEERRADLVEAVEDRESVHQQVTRLREERDALEAELRNLRDEEARFSERLLAEARDRREARLDPDRSEPATSRDEELAHLDHDLRDLEEISGLLGSASRELEDIHDALGKIADPGFLQVISGLALLDLFEKEEIRQARDGWERARAQIEAAEAFLENLEAVTVPREVCASLQDLCEHPFFKGLYHEGRLGKVLTRDRAATERYRERLWSIRTELRALKDGLLTRLEELRHPPAPG